MAVFFLNNDQRGSTYAKKGKNSEWLKQRGRGNENGKAG
jgi:hypothetical protein